MTNKLSILLIALAVFFTSQVSAQVDHSAWNDLLSSNVSAEGKVNYKGFMSEEAKLDAYLATIADASIPANEADALALWMNAYNAYTVKLIISNWPVSSIKDVAAKVGTSTPWDYSFAVIGGETYTLNQVEHEVIRPQFNEPRIHFAVNCAAESCPPLLNSAYVGSELDAQLETQTKNFINNSARNTLSADAVILSQIFEWFKDDFIKLGSLISFINQYSDTKISESAAVSFQEYMWNLNN